MNNVVTFPERKLAEIRAVMLKAKADGADEFAAARAAFPDAQDEMLYEAFWTAVVENKKTIVQGVRSAIEDAVQSACRSMVQDPDGPQSRPDGKSKSSRLVRALLEVRSGTYDAVDKVIARSDPDELHRIEQAILRDIKEALWGLSPIFGKPWVLRLCRAIIDEDEDRNGKQTVRASDYDQEMREKRKHAPFS